MKPIKERYPSSALKIRNFLMCLGSKVGCPLLLNHEYDKIKIIVLRTNAVSYNGIGWTAIRALNNINQYKTQGCIG